MNTRFSYLYRDAYNYKQYGEVIFAGEIDSDSHELITNSMGDGGFIASQVGLPDLQEFAINFPTDADHVWSEFEGLTTTSEAATGGSIQEFAKRFDGIVWDEAAAAERLGLATMSEAAAVAFLEEMM